MFGLTVSVIIATASLYTATPQINMGFYPMTTVVTDVNYDTDEVTCTDFNGNDWVFTECEDWNEGDICSMIMCDNGTEIIYDDIIISERYDGWFDGWGNN
jgi:hypothetical protein